MNVSRSFGQRGLRRRVCQRGWLRDARHREITSRVSHPRGGWLGGTDSVHSAPLDHRPAGYLSCLLVYEIQHCYLAPHRRVLGTVWPLVSGEFPTLKGRVAVHDCAVTYPRFFPHRGAIVLDQAGSDLATNPPPVNVSVSTLERRISTNFCRV